MLCIECQKGCKVVSYKTILHHIKSPWEMPIKDQAYYFCHTLDCDVVYIGLDNSVIGKDQLRNKIGIKECDDDALLCYCFGVTKGQAKLNKQIKEFVIEQTKTGICSCVTHNPSGHCCLKDFPF